MVIDTNWLKTVSECEPACLYTSKSLQTSVVTAVDFLIYAYNIFFSFSSHPFHNHAHSQYLGHSHNPALQED